VAEVLVEWCRRCRVERFTETSVESDTVCRVNGELRCGSEDLLLCVVDLVNDPFPVLVV